MHRVEEGNMGTLKCTGHNIKSIKHNQLFFFKEGQIDHINCGGTIIFPRYFNKGNMGHFQMA